MRHRRVASLIALVAMTFSASCALSPDERVRASAPSDAVLCGGVSAGVDGREQELCIARAFTAHRAFFVRFDQPGIDSRVSHYFVGDAEGHVVKVAYDSLGERYECFTCESPGIDPSTGFLECASFSARVGNCP